MLRMTVHVRLITLLVAVLALGCTNPPNANRTLSTITSSMPGPGSSLRR